MLRIKLFFFGIVVSFMGLFRPHEVLAMVQAREDNIRLSEEVAKIKKGLGIDEIENHGEL